MNEKQNRRLMHIIRQVHGLIENDDIQKQRDSQNQLANLLTNNKNYKFSGFHVNNLYFEWTEYLPKNIDSSSSEEIIFYCHGGGYMTGSCLYAREITSKLAKQTSKRVLCFDYRLAPEHPYPAALNDAFFAWKQLISLGFHADNIIIAGDSAGGNLALALTLMLQRNKMPIPKCLVLLSPWTDMTSSGNSYNAKELLDPVLNSAYIKKATQNYLQGATPMQPLVSPLFADLQNFPPVYIQVGENEILLDDSRNLYKRLLSCNVYAKLDIFSGMWHVFQMSPIKAAIDAMNRINNFINGLDKL